MIQVEQTEFWSDVEAPSGPVTAVTFSRRGDTVYVDETASLTDWFLEGGEDRAEMPRRADPAPEAPAPVMESASMQIEASEAKMELPARAAAPHATVTCPVSASTTRPTFNMARFLTLTGSLDSVEEEGRYLVLPRRGFRPHVVLDAVRRISKDFLKDLRSPPRSYSISPHQRPSGWMQL